MIAYTDRSRKAKRKKLWSHTHFGHARFILWHTHTYTTPTSWLYHFWFACYRAGWLQVFIILTSIWSMYKMAYYTEFAVYSWGRTSPIINCMLSKGGVWECNHIGKTEKESTHFVHCHTLFLTCLRTHYTHILSYHFWFPCYRFGRL